MSVRLAQSWVLLLLCHIIFDPDVYPLNWACWNGKVSQHWQDEEHPVEVQHPVADAALPELE